MAKFRIEWTQILHAGKLSIYPLVLFITPALARPGVAIQQTAEGGSVAVSDGLVTYLQVVLVVIVGLLLLGIPVHYLLSRKRRKQSKVPAPKKEIVGPLTTVLVQTGVLSNNGFQGDFKDTLISEPQDVEEAPLTDREIRGHQAAGINVEQIRVFCTVHRVGFTVARGINNILCPLGPHVIARDFPYGGNLVFCCDCGRFSVAIVSEESSTKACPSCDRAMVRMYLCDRCHVLSTESRALTGNRYEITDKGISPFCPGCLLTPPVKLWNHQCAPVEAELLSAAFQPCQWCEQAPQI